MVDGKLPTGIQSFPEIREDGCRYVDKTAYAGQLAAEGKHYFLSRPRRFGKSLFVSMLEALFRGERSLFKGLDIEPDWDWDTRHPVIRLDFGSDTFSGPGQLESRVGGWLHDQESEVGLSPESPDVSAALRLERLIRALHERSGQRVVLLVDEYDRPITNPMERVDDPGAERVARANREYLRGLYAVTKTQDEHIKFSFFTGVTMFTHTSLFSGANNLTDISLDPRYSTICGYTEDDLDRVFGDRIEGFDRAEIRDWYNGYSWGGADKIYNPYCILRLLVHGEFQPWWYATGTPRLLVNRIVDEDIRSLDLDNLTVDYTTLAAFDVGKVPIEALLFQSGYLTIQERERLAGRYRYHLACPNREVREALNSDLVAALVPKIVKAAPRDGLRRALQEGDTERLGDILHGVLGGMPHQWVAASGLASYEGHYASIVRGLFLGAGLDVRAEDSTNQGRLDMAVLTPDATYLFECKVTTPGTRGAAMAQMLDRGYAEGFAHLGPPVRLIGLEFDQDGRNLARLEHEAGAKDYPLPPVAARRGRGRGVSL